MARPYGETNYGRRFRVRQFRAIKQALVDLPTRAQIRAAFEAYGALTVTQVQRHVSKHIDRRSIFYHVRCMAKEGILVKERDGGRTGDGSRWRYTLRTQVPQQEQDTHIP
jgi:hypothetical protein